MTYDDAVKELIKAKLLVALISLDDVRLLDYQVKARAEAIKADIEALIRYYDTKDFLHN